MITASKNTILFLVAILGLVLVGCIDSAQAVLSSAAAQDMGIAIETISPADIESSTHSSDTVESVTLVNTVEEQIIALYQSASPSVVNITSVEYVYNRMLGQLPEEGVGSGFIYDNEGHIVTNYHVIENADVLIVTLATGEKYEAAAVGVDAVNDLAVLSIDAGDSLPEPLPLADSQDVQVGETVLAIGNPYGLDQTLTTGVVSALGRVIESTEDGQFIGEAIQTDAAINPGNSGGPLLNMEGAVIGVNSQIISTSGSSAGVGFAISSNTIQRIVPELIANGIYRHPWLGVQTIDLTDYSAAVLREAGMTVSVETGVLVVGVDSGSPAESAGIDAGNRRVRFGPYTFTIGGDIITAINDVPVETLQDLMVYLEMHSDIGEIVQLTIIRDNETISVPVTLTAQQVTQ